MYKYYTRYYIIVVLTLFPITIFSQINEAKNEVSQIFADDMCTELRKGTNQKKINSITDSLFQITAQQIFNKTYVTDFRIQDYEAYATLETLAKEMKTSYYNRFENPTGIYFNSNSEAIILVEDNQAESIAFVVNDFGTGNNDTYTLNKGYNRLKIKNSGLGYIHFYTDNYKNILPVKLHIIGGRVNGYFDKDKHSLDDWQSTLTKTVCDYIDIKGKYINLCYKVDDLKKYCKDGIALIDFYDKVVDLEYDLMGLHKYNCVPKNHMFARTTENGLFADGIGAGLATGYMYELGNPEKIYDGTWTIAHELGHVNQIRPGLKWVSTSEVTNNVYSSYIQYYFTPTRLRLEHERINDGDGNNVIGGRFNAYLNNGILKGEQWLCQRGPDRMKGYENGGDHFVKLCPLWQLMLYYRIAGTASWTKPDWYGDIAEIVRNMDDSKMSNGQLQLNFIKNACDVTGEDLTGFFIKAGMLKPINKELDDYTRGWLKITQDDCDRLIKYASRYPKPQSPVIYYITGNSVAVYEKKLQVTGNFGKGVEMNADKKSCIIDHNIWKNVTVFETYINDELEKIAMVGTNSPDGTTTLVQYPEGATRIEAVAWDGARTLVYGER